MCVYGVVVMMCMATTKCKTDHKIVLWNEFVNKFVKIDSDNIEIEEILFKVYLE